MKTKLINKALTVLLMLVIFVGLYMCVAEPIIASLSKVKTGFDAADRSILPWRRYNYRMPMFDISGRYAEPNEIVMIRAGDAVVGDIKVLYNGKVESLCDDNDWSMSTANIIWFKDECEVASAGNNRFFVARQIDLDEVKLLSRMIFFAYDYNMVSAKTWPYNETVFMKSGEVVVLD